MNSKRSSVGFNARERLSVFSLSGVFLLRMLGIFIVLPMLSPFALSLLDGTPSAPVLVGLVMGAYPLAQTLMQVPLGWLSDQVGRKPVIIGGLGLFAFGSLLAGFAHSIWTLIPALFIQGLGAIGSSIMALIADLTRPEVRTRAMAVIGAGIGVAFGLGMIGGSFLPSQFGPRSVFFLMVGLAVGAIGIIAVLVPTPDTIEHHGEVEFSLSRVGRVLKTLNLWRLNGGVFVLNGSLRALFTVLPLMLANVVAGPYIPWFYVGVLSATALIAFPIIFLSERKGKIGYALLLGMVGLVVGLGLLTLTEARFGTLLFAMILYFSGFSILEALLPSMLSREVSRRRRGTAMGLFHMSQYFGSFCGGLLGGLALKPGNSKQGVFVLVMILLVYCGDQLRRVLKTSKWSGENGAG
ncbi:MAG: MFS transporter [bacterium]